MLRLVLMRTRRFMSTLNRFMSTLNELSGIWAAISALTSVATVFLAYFAAINYMTIPDVRGYKLQRAEGLLHDRGFIPKVFGKYPDDQSSAVVHDQDRLGFSLSRGVELTLAAGSSKQSTAEELPRTENGDFEDHLIAHYQLNDSPLDNSRISQPMDLRNTEFRMKSLYLNGHYQHDMENGYVAIAKLRNFNYSSFTMSVDFFACEFSDHITDDFEQERTNILTGGTSYRWFAIRWNNGFLELTLNNQEFRHTYSTLTLEISEMV